MMSFTEIVSLYEKTVRDFIEISSKEIEITKNLEFIEQWKEKNNISKLILPKDLLIDVNNAKDLRRKFFHDNNESILS